MPSWTDSRTHYVCNHCAFGMTVSTGCRPNGWLIDSNNTYYCPECNPYMVYLKDPLEHKVKAIEDKKKKDELDRLLDCDGMDDGG